MNLRSTLPAFVLDALLIIVFAMLGRSSHTLELTAMGVLETAWPFLVGLAVSWIGAVVWRAPVAPIRAGLPLWVGTVAIGMLIRALTGAGTALPFVLVATGTIGLMLVGWRALSAVIRRMRTRR